MQLSEMLKPSFASMFKGNQKKWLLGASLSFVVLIGAIGGWYVFIEGAPQLDAPQAELDTGLKFQVETFKSQTMGEPRSYGVVLPPGYTQHSQRRYPVIFLLHGGHGSARDFEDKAKLTSVLHRLYSNHQLPPSIVVTPDGSDQRGSSPFWDPEYYNGPNGKVSSLIGEELVNLIKSRYRALHSPQFWAMGGISSGGWGALNIGLHHLDQFGILFSHTGYFIDPSGKDNSPQLLIQTIPARKLHKLRVYLDAGEEDREYLDATRTFHEVLDRLKVQHEFRIFPGGHGIIGQDTGWNYWNKHLTDSLSFVGKQFRANVAPLKNPLKP